MSFFPSRVNINVGTVLGGKKQESDGNASKKEHGSYCALEVRYKGLGTKSIGSDLKKYKFWWNGGKTRQNWVGIELGMKWLKMLQKAGE